MECVLVNSNRWVDWHLGFSCGTCELEKIQTIRQDEWKSDLNTTAPRELKTDSHFVAKINEQQNVISKGLSFHMNTSRNTKQTSWTWCQAVVGFSVPFSFFLFFYFAISVLKMMLRAVSTCFVQNKWSQTKKKVAIVKLSRVLHFWTFFLVLPKGPLWHMVQLRIGIEPWWLLCPWYLFKDGKVFVSFFIS